MQCCAHQWWHNHVEVLQVPILWIPEAWGKDIHQELRSGGREMRSGGGEVRNGGEEVRNGGGGMGEET